MKICYLFQVLFALTVVTTATAQPVIKRQQSVGGMYEERFSCMALTRDGGVIIGGTSVSSASGDKTEDAVNFSFDYWVIKKDSLGNTQWNKTIGGNRLDELITIHQTADGGYILGGYSDSEASGDKTDNNRGTYNTYDYWIVKLNASGLVQWEKTIGGSDDDILKEVRQTSDGGYILAGSSMSGISGEKNTSSRGYYDYWIVKTDASGNVLWDKTIGGSNEDMLTAMIIDRTGAFELAGRSLSDISGEKTANDKQSLSFYDGFRGDYWLVKTDASGNVLWDKTIGGAQYDGATSIIETNDGGFILGGTSQSYQNGDKSEIHFGQEDLWIVKTNATGDIEWNKTLGGTGLEQFCDVKQCKDGGYIVAGSSQSDISYTKTENNLGLYSDYWVVKLNRRGKVLWDKTIGGDNADFLIKIEEVKRNVYLLGGQSSSGVSALKTVESKGRDDYWMVLISDKDNSPVIANTGITQTLIPKTKFNVFPNPARDIVAINVDEATPVTITDASGKQLFSKTIPRNYKLDISAFKQGVYFILNQQTKTVIKLVVSK